MTVNFKDNFSKQSAIYAKYRPSYPVELYAFLSSLTAGHNTAWDCGTGNGQAAVGLADFYEQVIATDPSEEQIANCFPHAKVKYVTEQAENFAGEMHSTDIITIANALHWFDMEAFYSVVNRVLKKDGIIAAWAYGMPNISPEIDALVKELHDHTLNDFWVAENRLVENGYRDIPFPFVEIPAPSFISQKEFDLHEFVVYLHTWSATQKFITKYNLDPIEKVKSELRQFWGDEDLKRKIRWKLIIKVGRIKV